MPNKVDRRKFLTTTAAGAAGASIAVPAVAAPAVIASNPVVEWRLVSSFPKSLDTIHGAGDTFAKALGEMSGGNFRVRVFAPGELVPGMNAADAVQNGSVEAAHTASYYYWGKDPTFAIATAVPFGLNYRMQNAWMYQGGGIDLMNAFYQRYNIIGFPGGNTGTQMGGWYRRQINAPEDWRGLKMRIGGLAGAVIAKLGGVPQQIAGGDIYPSLEKGTIDAAEWVGPYDDEKLGFSKVARYYYYPGWWEGQAMLHFFINMDQWNALPKHYQAMVRSAATMADIGMMTRYDLQNPAAIKRIAIGGAEPRPFSEAVLEACFKASNEVFDEICAKNADFKKVYEATLAIRGEDYLWFQLAEHTYDTFMMIQQRKGLV
ncbi:ABC transporter substrate-binding protein [Hyphomicrobium sp. D-2]|uniref:TRAP transporter substrate-binding protein n=1 Tax=Hyphomicrobium sp. D-2 TaxID=3041621 RepID=UPI002454CA49|nr:ABC transporter substrate-binding protein [Hyphomicrobium sp. D-2]MDH4982485.1 ABC transporter substrate-binding protein [Hyphomicrobium sp. D-2]